MDLILSVTMHERQSEAPDSTAVRVALWRAMHLQVDPPPHVIEDEVGLRLAALEEGWWDRPDMDPHRLIHLASRTFSASQASAWL
jgi:hypothetical protein